MNSDLVQAWATNFLTINPDIRTTWNRDLENMLMWGSQTVTNYPVGIWALNEHNSYIVPACLRFIIPIPNL